MKRVRDEPCAICEHYHDYEGGEPCAVCGHCLHSVPAPALPSSRPAEVVPPFLFVGSYSHASGPDLLKALGITHVLNTVPSCQNLYRNTFDYHTATSNPPDFDECINYIEAVRTDGKGSRVLVHCMSGTSRSPAIAAAYLLRHRGWRLDDCVAWVAARHPEAKLSRADLERLARAEEGLRAAHAADVAAAAAAAPAPKFAWLESARSAGGSAPGGAAAWGHGAPQTAYTAPAMGGELPRFDFVSSGPGNSNGFVFGGAVGVVRLPTSPDADMIS